MISLAIFDLDGTILYTLPDLCAAMNAAMRAVGEPEITIQQASACIGNGIRKFAQRAMQSQDDNDPRIDIGVAAFKEYYRVHLADNTVPYNGMVQMIKELMAAGIKCAVLSNKYDEATKYLCGVFYPGLFDAVYGEGAGIPRKPDPKGVLTICSELGIKPVDSVYIGDSGVDYKTAVSSGTKHISVLWGYRSYDVLKQAGAVNFAANADELKKLILEI